MLASVLSPLAPCGREAGGEGAERYFFVVPQQSRGRLLDGERCLDTSSFVFAHMLGLRFFG